MAEKKSTPVPFAMCIKQSIWLATTLLGCLMLAQSVQAASFDCRKAKSKVEHIICDDAEISKLDDELSAAYKAALKAKSQAEAIKQAQKQWVKERNNCRDVACVSSAYETRLVTITATDNGIAATEDNHQDGQQYRFQLTKGKGTPVCDAYLVRLNTTHFEKPPYCDRPENDTVPGFTKLNRVPLSPSDVHDLYPILQLFILTPNNDKKLDWTSMAFQQDLVEHGQFRLTEEGMKGLQSMLDNGWAKIWRYEPLIDIDNDGALDHVQVWHGYPLNGVGATHCGDDGYPVTHYGEKIRQPQAAFVVSAKGDRLDIAKTKEVFAHPIGGYPLHMDKHWKMADCFRPVGLSTGIFKYQELYYFDTFFDGWGDFDGKRRNEGTQHKYKEIGNTLAVLLHKDGKTRQVCEYLMTDNGTQNERGAK